ncbi:hypothetical protein GQ54DRAFT_1459 [Martensiomyces pterosporus]|nr:hypothetical protein GQ54DRAFT_1459 [Martensiomyces pterosporus]
MEFRSQVRKQLLDSEIREIDALYSASLDRVDEQKSGNSERLKPTAPRLVIARQRSQVGDSAKKGDAVVLEDPKQQQQQQKESASRDASYYTKSSVSPSYRSRGHGDAERKRTRLPHTQEAGPESQYENASDPTAAGRVAKRTRRVYDTISNTAAYRTTTTTSNPGEPAEPARSTTPQKAGASSSGGMSEDMLRDLRDLRMENSELKLQLRKLELALEQHQVEVHSWMLRVERSIQGYNAYHQQQQPASPELEVAPPMQPPQAAAISVSSSSHQRPQAPQVQAPSQSAHAAYPAQQRAYGDRTQQQQQPQQNSHSVSLPSIHESLNQFDRHAPTEVAGSDRYGRLRDTTRASPVDSSLPGVRGYQIPASRLPHNGDDLVNGRGAMPPQHLTNGTKTGQYQQQPQRVYSSPVQVSSPREHGYPQNALSSEYHNQQDYRGAHQQHANGIDRAEHQWYHGQHEHQQQYASRRTPPMHQHTHGY